MRVDVHYWRILIVLSRLDLISMLYADEFDEDGKTSVSIEVHPDIRRMYGDQ